MGKTGARDIRNQTLPVHNCQDQQNCLI